MIFDPPALTVDGRVLSEAVEINAVWHCNISCRWCSHGSPLMPTRIADTQVVKRDLQALAKWMYVEHVRVLGGEPLIHPQLPDLLAVIRISGISDRVRILTNGLALHKMPLEAWQLVDEIHVSVYPNTARNIESRLPAIRRIASASNTSLTLKYFDYFRISYRMASSDSRLTQRIYRTCQIGNVWRCLTVDNGRLYRCPQSAFLEAYADAGQSSRKATRDGIIIEGIRSAEDIQSWMIQADALLGCRTCAGSVGMRVPHQQLSSGERERLALNQTPFITGTEDVLDYEYLALLERDKDADNECVSRSIELT